LFREHFDAEGVGSCQFDGFLQGLVPLLLQSTTSSALKDQDIDFAEAKKCTTSVLVYVFDKTKFSPVLKTEMEDSARKEWEQKVLTAAGWEDEVFQELLGLVALNCFVQNEEQLEFSAFESQVGGHKGEAVSCSSCLFLL
jgi:hypothetical protein